MRRWLNNSNFILATLFLLVSTLLFGVFFTPSPEKEFDKFHEQFIRKKVQLHQSMDEFASYVTPKDSLPSIWKKTKKFRRSDFVYYLYDADTLIYWTSNKAPFTLENSEVTEGVVLLENGWYYLHEKAVDQRKLVGLFLIKNEYPYENESLSNHFNEDFSFPFTAVINQFPDKYDVTDEAGNFLFSLRDFKPLPNPDRLQVFFFLSVIFTLFFFFRGIITEIQRQTNALLYLGVVAILLLFIRWMLMRYDGLRVFEGFTLLDPQLFASSALFPTLGDLIINVLLLVLFVKMATQIKIPELKNGLRAVVGVLSLLLFFGLSYLYTVSIHHLILDSDIPIELYRFMDLNLYSFILVGLIGILLYVYYTIALVLLRNFSFSGLRPTTQGVFWFFFSILYFFVFILLPHESLAVLLLSVIFSGVILFLQVWKPKRYSFPRVVLILALLTAFSAFQIQSTIQEKSIERFELYATKLISDKDLNTEIEYGQLGKVLQQHPLLVEAFNNSEELSLSDVKNTLEKRFFNQYWSRYETDFFLFDSEYNPIAPYAVMQDGNLERFNELLASSAEPSEISENIYYITDYSDKLSYLIRQPVYAKSDSLLGYLFCTLKSKIIPQEIGFPRLLLSEESRVFFPLEEYSIAKYVGGKLVSRHGAYNYPLSLSSFLSESSRKSGYFIHRRDAHYVLFGDYERTIVLSRPVVSFSEKLTSFSLLFSIFGLLLLAVLLSSGKLIPDLSRIRLAFRIQLLLITLVFFSLLFLSLGTGSFVKDQYDDYRDGLIREKLTSVNLELVQKLGYETSLKRSKMASYLEYLLQKFSIVFVTDINLYGLNGELLASSRPEIYNLGLISDQINPRAFRNIGHKMKSVYIHEEEIGNLTYLSAYIPLQNNEDEVIAYINLPYFAKQNEFENEIAGFLSEIINIFVLLLTLSIIVTVVITNRITEPLKLLQRSLAELRLGKSNKPIYYKRDDEIGALVKEYNAKLKELEINAEKLAQTEREVAWREMAKQVAHEIKNPLTPMKLRIQHLQRSFDPSDPDSVQRLDEVAQSIVEQIDALTVIANEFSNFAKLPKPNKDIVDLNMVIKNVVTTFEELEEVDITTSFQNVKTAVFADKDLMIRVFNNLVKNAAQAIPEERKGEIFISVRTEEGVVKVAVRDNGSGIPDEMRDKIFAPNFTTKSTGMGLGLAMVRQIIESHDGQIYFESSETGSTFFIELKEYSEQ